MENKSRSYKEISEKNDRTMSDLIKKRNEDFHNRDNTPTRRFIKKMGLNNWDVLGSDNK